MSVANILSYILVFAFLAVWSGIAVIVFGAKYDDASQSKYLNLSKSKHREGSRFVLISCHLKYYHTNLRTTKKDHFS